MTPSQLEHAAALLAQVLRFQKPADVLAAQYFAQNRQLGKNDRARITQTVFAAIRHHQKISAVLPQPQQQHRLAALAAQYFAADTLPEDSAAHLRPEEKTWLNRLRQTPFPTTLNTAAELPQWLTELLSAHLSGDEITAFGRSAIETAPLDLRVNTLKGKRDKILAQLAQEFPDATATPFSPLGIRLPGKPAIGRHPLFLNGTLEIQDEGSQLLALLTGAKRSEIIVDFCAGAGGKALAIAAQMADTGRIYALDTAEKRLANIKERARRADVSVIQPQRISSEHDPRIAKLRGKADRVLVDAPCSGLGTLRRSPDLKYRQNPHSIAELIRLQQSILTAAAQLVKPGGRLVYATCSILPQENREQAETFLQNHPEFELINADTLLAAMNIPLQTGRFLHLNTAAHQTDAFFAAVMQRKTA